MVNLPRPAALLPVAFGLGLALTLDPSSVTGQTAALEITSDTPEYCLHLLDRVSSLVRESVQPPPHEVTDLSSEGQRMCDHGQTRGGIMRLRRALVLMQQARN
jgi:hypothetical protein